MLHHEMPQPVNPGWNLRGPILFNGILAVVLCSSCIQTTEDEDLDLEILSLSVDPVEFTGSIEMQDSTGKLDTIYNDSIIYYTYLLRNNGSGTIRYNEMIPIQKNFGDTVIQGNIYVTTGIEAYDTSTVHSVMHWFPPDTGTFTMVLEVNYTHKFQETDYLNNSKAVTFHVSRQDLRLIIE